MKEKVQKNDEEKEIRSKKKRKNREDRKKLEKKLTSHDKARLIRM